MRCVNSTWTFTPNCELRNRGWSAIFSSGSHRETVIAVGHCKYKSSTDVRAARKNARRFPCFRVVVPAGGTRDLQPVDGRKAKLTLGLFDLLRESGETTDVAAQHPHLLRQPAAKQGLP